MGVPVKKMLLTVSGSLLAATKNVSLNLEASPIEVRNSETGQYPKVLQGQKSGKIDCEMDVYKHTSSLTGSQATLYRSFTNGEEVTAIVNMGEGMLIQSGSCVITSLSFEGANDESSNVTAQVSLMLTSDLYPAV